MATTNELHVGTLFSLKDYVCVVTGGGTGIGLMASQALAANGMLLPRPPQFQILSRMPRTAHYWEKVGGSVGSPD